MLLAAAAAFLLRLPGLLRPIRADEAGFLLVSRAWHPSADSLYGPYFVDRPPLLIATFGLADDLGGDLFIRVLGALACALFVLAAAASAHLVAGPEAARWTAVVAAALTVTPLIDVVAVKGELLGIPLVTAGCGAALQALREQHRARSSGWALLAGLAASTAIGFKQNLVGGLVFAGVLLLVAAAARTLPLRSALRLGAAGLLGAAVPVAATVGWARASGVRLETLWYAVYGFRSDASVVLAADNASATGRAAVLAGVAVATGIVVVLGLVLRHGRALWRADRALTAATLALVTIDQLTLVAGGSYWRDYLFALLPGTALSAALLVAHAPGGLVAVRRTALGAAASAALALAGWSIVQAVGLQEFDEADTGAAIAAAAEPGDTLVVFGGRADVQLASGLSSPYAQLWSLPMRTLDPDLADLDALVVGADRPTWVVEWVPFGTWFGERGDDFERLLETEYAVHGTGCGGRAIYLLRDVDRATVTPDCR